jgi:hypothetical protein
MAINQSYYDIYSNLVTLLGNVMESHKNVSSFSIGEIDDYTITGQDTYPMCFVELPLQTNFQNNSINWNIAFTVLSQTKHDRSDENQNINSSMNIAMDIVEALKDLPTAGFTAYTNSNSYWVEPNSVDMITLTRFKDDFNAGVRVELTLGQLLPVNTCELSNSFNL